MALLAALAASNLPSLWVMIGAQLNAIDFWSRRPGPIRTAGSCILPIILALFVPCWCRRAALFAIAYPLALLLLMPARRPLFPTLLVHGRHLSGRTRAGRLAGADMLGRLAEQALIAMDASGDAEVLRLAVDLRVATEIVILRRDGARRTDAHRPRLGGVPQADRQRRHSLRRARRTLTPDGAP